MRARVIDALTWREPLDVLAAFADEPYAFALLSDGSVAGRWSFVGRGPFATFADLPSLTAAMAQNTAAGLQDGPPFQGGAVGLAAYEWGATLEPQAPQARCAPWPDFVGGVYDSMVAFDHAHRQAWAIGRGDTPAAAAERSQAAEALFASNSSPPPPPPRFSAFAGCPWDADYPAAVAAVVEAIGAGEIFQANVARGWRGRLATEATPYDLLRTLLAGSPAPFAGYLRLPGVALVSHSPERFLQVSAEGRAITRPIKGTRPRSADPHQDGALAEALRSSAKDRAENLMIVDLMRNDLSRTCRPGTVRVDGFCELESFSNVHHLVSTVSGRADDGATALEMFAAAFPPGSITGAPKLQAMRVIARHEPPRGPYCGALFWAGLDGAFDSSVLIRTVALQQDADGGWSWEARAGAAVTADSEPLSEDAECAAKISAIRAAVTGE